MASLSILSLIKTEDFCSSVDLFSISNIGTGSSNTSSTSSNANNSNIDVNSKRRTKDFDKSYSDKGCQTRNISLDSNGKQSICPLPVIIDGESCLDRLYGGYYSDWVSGGQWNRMLSYIGNLVRTCQMNKLQITVALRGGVEREHAVELFKSNREFKDRLNRVILHLQNRGTPPPKVWWLPPTCLREVIFLAMQFHGIPVLCTSGDYYIEVVEYAEANGFDGILSDNSIFALLHPRRIFAAHDLKLTYKGSLETREYLIEEWSEKLSMNLDRLPLLASLLGNHILPLAYLKEFHQELSGGADENKTAEEVEMKFTKATVAFVKDFPDPNNLEAIGNVVFRNSSYSLQDGISKLKESVAYFKRSKIQNTQPKKALKTTLNMHLVPGGTKQANDNQSVHTSKSQHGNHSNSNENNHVLSCNGNGEMEDKLENMTMNGDINGNGITQTINVEISPSDAILRLSTERHKKGLMSPFIMQALFDREVRLPSYIENVQVSDESKTVLELYKPIRQSTYAILHNLNKHLYDTRKVAEDGGKTLAADDIGIDITEHYIGLVGTETSHRVKVSPLTWPVPSIESLWLGIKPENKQRRMKAFLSCMQTGSDPLITNVSHVPERFLILCCVLRYLLKCEPAAITLTEVDAALSMATSSILFDVQTMQDMQLPLITPRGAHVASMIMAGVQHAMLVNDVCGAPIRKELTPPWLYFDGKLFQYKLLKASNSPHIQRLDLCDGQMAQVIQMERLRQVVLHGLEDRFTELTTSSLVAPLPGGRVYAAPAAYLRPTFTTAGRGVLGKASLMGEFLPLNSHLDSRGGKLQVAGQVVATWGPRPECNQGRKDPGHPIHGENHSTPHEQLSNHKNSLKLNGRKPVPNHKKIRGDIKSKTTDTEQPDSPEPDVESKPMVIATKCNKGEQVDVKVLPDDNEAGNCDAPNNDKGNDESGRDGSVSTDTSAAVVSP